MYVGSFARGKRVGRGSTGNNGSLKALISACEHPTISKSPTPPLLRAAASAESKTKKRILETVQKRNSMLFFAGSPLNERR